MIVLAGVDAGGSHTEAAISTRGFRSIKRGAAGPGFVGPARVAIATAEIEKAVRNALARSAFARADVLVVGAAGAGDAGYRNQLERALHETHIAGLVHVVTDAELVLECAFPSQPGILVMSGTGSIAVGRDPSGAVHRVGGHGYEFGDEGSGYALGRAAIRSVFQAVEGRGDRTVLQDMLFAEAGAASVQTFSRWTRIADRRTVAELASVVQLAAQSGDETAVAFVKEAARELLHHVLALLPLVHPTGSGPIAMAGGLLANATPVRSEFLAQLRRALPGVQLVEETIDPVMGALMIAKRVLSSTDGKETA
jgi:glucosamine kinase